MSEKLKIVYRPLQELSPYAHNARTHSPEQVAQLVESIKQFGWTNPVLIDEKGEIIAGHGRVMAAEMLKMDSVPVIVLSGLTDEQKKAYRLADNRLPMNAGWDEDLLRMELSDLINADFDVSLTGFIPTEIDELLTDVLPGTGNEEEPYTTKIDMAGVAYSRVSTFSGDYLRVIDNKGKTHDVLTGSDDGRHSNTSLAWGAGVQFNPTESVAIDIAYEGSGSGDWRTDGFIVGVGYKF
ncbi:Ail/Lom family outer membrane beta-barrel protein [Escherichia coli]|uniref:Ail/Lom family outer membrane beta-barrel protein n=3 Tax=Escherichia coli TaxID=562 RepID=UPI001122D03B|nr:Ail/Lom family outer membrane beta-barrel protein [Escherichia coli]TNU37194.1 hypothetical protein FIB67_16290 [Escherichia coli]